MDDLSECPLQIFYRFRFIGQAKIYVFQDVTNIPEYLHVLIVDHFYLQETEHEGFVCSCDYCDN